MVTNDTIELKGMDFFAFHGCWPSERAIGGRYKVSVRISGDCSRAGQTDRLSDALNYQTVYDITCREMAIPSDLLEHVCTRIIDAIFEIAPLAASIRVKVSKMNPQLGGKVGSATVSMTRNRI
ncbi:MAG: dihydroneopterin aldolase [Bacteroidales bacterium]|jgi:dihydroneopterin aldolase|nr:dihydroneopterin aldolase [Bacteroidales bacterium]